MERRKGMVRPGLIPAHLALVFAASLGCVGPGVEDGFDGVGEGPPPNRSRLASADGPAEWSPPAQNLRCQTNEGGDAFVDVTDCVGLADATHVITDLAFFGMGQAFGDFDRDGWLDLYVTDMDGPNRLYRNLGDGTFALFESHLDGIESAGATFVDYDNDGWPDLFVANRGVNALLRNQGGTGFVDVTEPAGLAEDHAQSVSSAWADYDGDGWLDLYVVNYYDPRPDGTGGSTDRLYHANGDGTFRDVTLSLWNDLVTGLGLAASWLDFDDDGDQDLYVVNDKGYPGSQRGPFTNRPLLWRNDGPGCGSVCFEEVAFDAGADHRISGMGLAVGDYDRDQSLDLFATDVDRPEPRNRSVLLRNVGGGFEEVAEAAGIPTDLGIEWGTFFFDYDLDGWLDLFVAREYGTNALLRNRGDGTFEDRADEGVAGMPAWNTFGAAYGDYDRDGRVDLVAGHRGWGYHLYRNTGQSAGEHGWLTVHLVGTGPINRDAVGARITIHTDRGDALVREVTCGSSFGAGNALASYFGLGDARATSVEIRWPNRETDVFSHPPQNVEITYRYEY